MIINDTPLRQVDSLQRQVAFFSFCIFPLFETFRATVAKISCYSSLTDNLEVIGQCQHTKGMISIFIQQCFIIPFVTRQLQNVLHCYNYRKYRYTAYRQLVRWCWGMLGRNIRVPLPSCCVHKIRGHFPLGTPPTGFVPNIRHFFNV